MIEWPCNEVRNQSSWIIVCAFSSGGTVFDAGTWTVKMLLPGRMVDNKDVDYVAPYRTDLAMNGQLGWWKLFQGMPYVVLDGPQGKSLKLNGTWPRKKFDGKEEDFNKEWRALIDQKDFDFGKDIPGLELGGP
jgi:hypothetical protein